MARTHLLSTIDNPYNPHSHWDEWFSWDMENGYNTPGLLARITITSDELSEEDQDLAIEMAMDEILKEDLVGMYTKVAPGD